MSELASQTPLDGDSEDIVHPTNYVLVLTAWWREVVLGTFLVAIGCGILMLAVQTLLPRYEASSYVTILRVTSNVAIDKRFSTGATTDDQASWRRRGILARNSRRAGLVGLVKSGNVARAVAEDLSEKLGEKKVSAAQLLETVDAELVTVGTLSMRNTSDLIRITARADSPEKSAFIADAWAEEYVNHVNQLYRHTPANQLTLILTEMKRTQETYDAVQKELETFLINSNVEKLNALLTTKQEAVSHLHSLQREAFKKALFSAEQDLERRTYAVDLMISSERDRLAETHARKRDLETLLTMAEDFRVQIKNGGIESGASNTLTLTLLKAAAYAPSNNLFSKSLEIDLAEALRTENDRRTALLTDLEAMISIVENRIEILDTSIVSQGDSLYRFNNRSRSPSLFTEVRSIAKTNSGRPTRKEDQDLAQQIDFVVNEAEGAPFKKPIDKLQYQIQLLKAEIETANSKRDALVQNRDVQQAALATLQNEIAELKLAMAAFTSEVRIAASALVPIDPAYPSAWLIAGLGGIAGLLATVGLAFSLNFGGSPPLLREWSATRPGRTRGAA